MWTIEEHTFIFVRPINIQRPWGVAREQLAKVTRIDVLARLAQWEQRRYWLATIEDINKRPDGISIRSQCLLVSRSLTYTGPVMSALKQTRLTQLVTLARVIFEYDDKVEYWLTYPQPALGNRRPIDIASSEPGYREVKDLLLRIEYGVYS